MNKTLYRLLCCPYCKNELLHKRGSFVCGPCGKKFPIQQGIPNFSLTIEEKGMRLSQRKWNEKYEKDAKKDVVKEIKSLDKKFFQPTWEQITKYKKLKPGRLFLEIGCGTFYLGRHLALDGQTVIGIDMSIEALKLARLVFEKEKIPNYLLVCGNVLNMPFKHNSFDLLYGAGVIEHFRDTLVSVKELQRVLKKGGVAYNTVPYLNLGSLTYRQVWGNIPRLPVLEDLFAFFHTRMLRAKHMRFGYELSFSQSYLKKIHKRAGFSQTNTGQFNCQLDFDYLKNKTLRRLAIHLATHSRLFWPMIYVAATK
ncbi:methyltransferase domain-containing protein [Patescibacteria group bacterium]|nr:methyltransferase domain-containing protein [Patescibacteria group bacterium]